MDLRLIRTDTGAVVQELDNIPTGAVSYTLAAQPAAGTVTYKLQVRFNSGQATSGTVAHRSMAGLVYKR